MEMVIAKYGHNLGISIPEPLANSLGLKAGSTIKLTVKRGRIVIEPVMLEKESLAALLAAVTSDNLHGGIETGSPVGREAK